MSDGDGFLKEAEHDPATAAREALLDTAADLLDAIGALEAQIEADGLTVPGSRGQPTVHPAVEQVRRQRLALAKVLSQVDTGGASQAGVALARKRWARESG